MSVYCEQQEEPLILISRLLLRMRRMYVAGIRLDFQWPFGVLIYQCGKFYQQGTLSIIFFGWFWGAFLVLWKLFLVSYWVAVWILFITVFSIIFITSLGDCTRPQHEEIPIFAGLASKFENVGPIFSSFNPCLSLPSIARDHKKQF